MTLLIEQTQGKTRDLPIATRLKNILLEAGEKSGVDKIVVISGGQCAKGKCSKRAGSTRHDLGQAADLQLWRGGVCLEFTTSAELPIFEAFVEHCAGLGATGIGAGVEYMGSDAMHIGFGEAAVWGAAGKSANAPDWLRAAVKKGWANGLAFGMGDHQVMARKGLHLRAGPGVEFETLSTIQAGTLLSIEGYDGPGNQWAKVDLEGDGLFDGHVHKAFLAASAPVADGSTAEQDNCSVDRGL